MNILTIEELRNREYKSNGLKVEEKVKDEEKFTSYIASYDSDGLKIYGYLVIPKNVIPTDEGRGVEGSFQQSLGDRDSSTIVYPERHHGVGSTLGVHSRRARNDTIMDPETSSGRQFPIVVFCHGRIEASEYRPQRQYARHCEYLASKSFVVFKPDYRGHGSSEGNPETIFESGYAVDVLNAISALSKPDCFVSLTVASLGAGAMTIDGTKIGIIGHSLGGNIALKVMEVNPNIKAGVIWAGAVAEYDEILSRWGKNNSLRRVAEELIEKYGEPKTNPEFWKSISPINFVEYINASILIQHGEKDESISTSQAIGLEKVLKQSGKHVELVLYKSGTHNFEAEIYDQAVQKAAEFFKLKII